MGKVQDTINSIARRHRHNATPALALIIPTQKKPTRQSFPTSYTSVAGWLAANTSTPYHTQLNGLTRALQHSNRLTNTATERLKIVTLFKTQIDAVMPSLNQQFIGGELPYNSKTGQSYESAKTLLRELAYGYKTALVDVLLRRSGLHRLDRIHATYYAMRFLAELGLRHSQSYQQWPAKCWRDINTLYWLAEKENASHETVRSAAGDSDIFPASIAGLYTTMSLFHLSNNNHLGATDMEKLIVQLTRHASLINLHSEKSPSSVSTLYSVSLNSASPPVLHRYCNYSDKDHIRYLDVAPINQALLEYRLENTDDALVLSQAQMQKVSQTLCNRSQRHTSRTVSDTAVSLQTGLKDCHALIQRQSDNHESLSANWRLLNRSRHGVCLQSANTGDHKFQVGTLITGRLHESELRILITGVVRWIKVLPQSEIQMGVELLGNNAKPAHCEKRTSGEPSWQPRLESLVFEPGNTESSAMAIALPENSYRPGDTLNIYPSSNSSKATAVKLIESLDYSAFFDFYRLVPVTTDQSAEPTPLPD